ncbi:hypothetical protein BO221_38470 [Archangium sp. Cb G35]|uniref:hypothetical protein n=1 Tax=Archangium sp. Cb G35 TaxID=1920190 RepID=UPI0009378365|nr:hypothetical protein [Archangium sp. Cb G35]OJT18640.1 hypothetical protein BO221_38470 [Archangium sp. Cb G35]
MMTPPNTFKSFVMYALGYAITIAALLLDIRYGQAIFAFIAFVGSIAVTAHLLYRTARAMAFSPTADRLQSVPVRVTAGGQRLAA